MSIFHKTMNNARFSLFSQLESRLYGFGLRLLQEAVKTKTWKGFTGNAQTSFAFGVYRDGKLSSYATGEDFQKAPLMKKIRVNRRVFLRKPYEGEARAVKGSEPVTNETGPEASLNILRRFKPSLHKGVSFVMVVGAEYIITRTDGKVLDYAIAASRRLIGDWVIKRLEIKSV